jgi:Enoyl-CoA hydratase/carnithine racemase
MYKTILVEKKNHLAILTLNRPEKLNAINVQVKREVSHALSELEADSDVRVVIMTGAGRAFSSGHDMTAPDSEREEFYSLKEEEKLVSFEKPIIAAIHGHTLGDGLQQALLCDIRIASDDAILGFIGPLVGGMCYGSFSILPLVVGRGKASELFFTCDWISAEEACKIGLVNKVVPREQLMPAAVGMAEKIMRAAPLSIKYTKRMLEQSFFSSDYKNLLREALKVSWASEDRKEALRAFKEKRAPVFNGR